MTSGGSSPISSRRRRTTPPCSPSATRSAPASTSSPTASSAAKATPTASPPRSTASTSTIPARSRAAAAASPPVPRVTGKIRRKHPVEVRDVRVPARPHRPADQDHGAGAVHHVGAVPGRLLWRRGEARHGLRGRRQRRDQGPVPGRRRHRADRRAVDGIALGEGEALRHQGARPRARRRQGHDRGPHLLRLRGRGARTSRPATTSCRSSSIPPLGRCRSRLPNPSSISRS